MFYKVLKKTTTDQFNVVHECRDCGWESRPMRNISAQTACAGCGSHELDTFQTIWTATYVDNGYWLRLEKVQ